MPTPNRDPTRTGVICVSGADERRIPSHPHGQLNNFPVVLKYTAQPDDTAESRGIAIVVRVRMLNTKSGGGGRRQWNYTYSQQAIYTDTTDVQLPVTNRYME